MQRRDLGMWALVTEMSPMEQEALGRDQKRRQPQGCSHHLKSFLRSREGQVVPPSEIDVVRILGRNLQ